MDAVLAVFYRAIENDCFVYGFDVMPESIKFLKDNRIYIDPLENIPNDIDGVCFWDSLEHMEYKKMLKTLENIPKNAYTFISMPLFESLDNITESKHYRPNEHLFYASMEGFTKLMQDNGFEGIDILTGEIDAGRSDITTFVMRKL